MPWTFYNASGQQLRSTATVLATQAEMEAGTALTSFVTPGRTQYHPGVLKVWVRWESQGTHSMVASYNMASVSDGGGAGDSDLLFTTDFSSANYALAGNTHAPLVIGTSGEPAAGGVTIHIWNSSDEVLTDASRIFLQCAGDQA